MFAAILAALANPAVDAAIAQAAASLVAYFAGLPEKDRAAAIAQVEAAATSSDAQVSAFMVGAPADLATAKAMLAAPRAMLAGLLTHPDLPPGLVPTVDAIRAQVSAIARPL